MKNDSFPITEFEKAELAVINVIAKSEPRQITSPICEALISKINLKYYDQRISNYFFKKYYCIDIGKHTHGTPQLLYSDLRLLKSIGSFCSIALGLTIPSGNHPITRLTTHRTVYNKRFGFVSQNTPAYILHPKNTKITIGNDVWIGQNAMILPSSEICDGAIVGAGAVVTGRIEPYSIAGGVPARHIKYRFNEYTIDALLKSKWWEMEDDRISEIYNLLHYSNYVDVDNDYNGAILKCLKNL